MKRNGPLQREHDRAADAFCFSFCKATSVMGCFICGDLQGYLERRKDEIKKKECVSFLSRRPSSEVNAQNGLGEFFSLPPFHGKVMATNHCCLPAPISWNITKDHPQFPGLNTGGEYWWLLGKVQPAALYSIRLPFKSYLKLGPTFQPTAEHHVQKEGTVTFH